MISRITGLIQQGVNSYLTNLQKEDWGLVDAVTHQNIANFSSFLECEILDENEVVSEAIEEGSFASYNKIEAPLEIMAMMAVEGTNAELQDALYSIRRYGNSTDLVNLVTPSQEYDNLNIEQYNYELKQSFGRGVLYVEFHLVEIREVASQYTNVKLAPRKNQGLVQTKNSSPNSAKNTAPKQSMAYAMKSRLQSWWAKK